MFLKLQTVNRFAPWEFCLKTRFQAFFFGSVSCYKFTSRKIKFAQIKFVQGKDDAKEPSAKQEEISGKNVKCGICILASLNGVANSGANAVSQPLIFFQFALPRAKLTFCAPKDPNLTKKSCPPVLIPVPDAKYQLPKLGHAQNANFRCPFPPLLSPFLSHLFFFFHLLGIQYASFRWEKVLGKLLGSQDEMKGTAGRQWNKIFMGNFRSSLHGVFRFSPGLLDSIVLILLQFERPLPSAQVR